MLDGMDEVSPNYTNFISNLLKELPTQLNLAKIFITTRPHLYERLERVLKVRAFTMEPFTEENQTNFLTNYWTEKLHLQDDIKKEKCKHYAKALIGEMSEWIRDNPGNTFARIPLQTRMLAEVFKEENQFRDGKVGDWEGCKEFLSSDGAEPKLSKSINLTRLYQMFIEKKRDIFLNDKSNPTGSAAAYEALKEKFEDCYVYHRSLALETIFDAEEWKLFTCHKNLDYLSSFVENYVLRVGIIQLRGEKLHFIHRTFAEYFAAECMLIELKRDVINPQLYQFLMRHIFYGFKCRVVRLFLDNLIKEEPSHVKNKIFKCFWTHDDKSHISRMLLYQIALSGCAEILTSFVEFVKRIRIQASEVQLYAIPEIFDYHEPLQIASVFGYLDIVKILVESAQIWVESALSEATKPGRLDIIKLLQEKADAAAYKKSQYEGSIIDVVSKMRRAKNGMLDEQEVKEDEQDKEESLYGLALFAAANHGQLAVVKFLADFADVNELHLIGMTVLCRASAGGYLDVVKFLVEEAGAYVNEKTEYDGSALQMATKNGHLSVVKYLIERGANDCGEALNRAVYLGYLHIVKFLVEFADVDEIINGMTALCEASVRGNLDIVKFLVEEAGADVNKKSESVQSALAAASFRGDLGIVEYLVKRGANGYSDALTQAAMLGHLDIVKFLVEFSDVDEVDSKGMTVLCAASGQGYLDVVKFLVEEGGADVNKKSESEGCALEAASKWGDLSIVKYLVERGANEYRRALSQAIDMDELEVVKFLIQFVYVDEISNGMTALCEASSKGCLEIVMFLVEEAGADVNKKIESGGSALTGAFLRGHLNIVKYLAERGAN